MKRPQLAASYVAIMLVGLLIFAAAAVVAIDRTLRTTLDARLTTEATAAATFVDVHDRKIAIDSDDRRQFLGLLGFASSGAVLDPSGNVLLSSTTHLPSDIVRLGHASGGYFDLGAGDAALRAFVLPIVRDDTRLGSVVVWRPSGWIADTDREAATAFAVAALVIALLALLAGDLVTRRAMEDAFGRQRRFTADASHELRAPLAVIRAEADLALRKERTAAEYQAAMQTIASESDRMESLIGDLLSAARAESRGLKRERVDLERVVRAVAQRLSSTLSAKHSELNVDIASPAYVVADAQALERAIMAVGHNAAQHVTDGGCVEMRMSRNGTWVEVDVEDSGPGFSEAALRHAFDRFWREDAQGGRHGSGLGLAIAKSIVESCGGHIGLSNRSEGGARVRLRLPAAG